MSTLLAALQEENGLSTEMPTGKGSRDGPGNIAHEQFENTQDASGQTEVRML